MAVLAIFETSRSLVLVRCQYAGHRPSFVAPMDGGVFWLTTYAQSAHARTIGLIRFVWRFGAPSPHKSFAHYPLAFADAALGC